MPLAVIDGMPKSKKPRPADKGRVQQQSGDTGRGRTKASAKQLDDLVGESDGVVDAEMEELDTDRYEPPQWHR